MSLQSQIIEMDYQLTGNDHLSVISAGNLNGDHYDDVVLTGRVHDDQGNPVLVSEILLGSSDGLAESASFLPHHRLSSQWFPSATSTAMCGRLANHPWHVRPR